MKAHVDAVWYKRKCKAQQLEWWCQQGMTWLEKCPEEKKAHKIYYVLIKKANNTLSTLPLRSSFFSGNYEIEVNQSICYYENSSYQDAPPPIIWQPAYVHAQTNWYLKPFYVLVRCIFLHNLSYACKLKMQYKIFGLVLDPTHSLRVYVWLRTDLFW